MIMESYVCAFRGRRDSYQVPLALAEVSLLDQFITDAYALPWVRELARFGPPSVRAKVALRSQAGVPAERVHCLWGTTMLEHARHRLGFAPMLTFNKLDRRFSRAAARRAARTRSNLFLYSPYAWEAFTARYPHLPRKVLFQYHPHPDLERRILSEDAARHSGIGDSYSGTVFGQVPEAMAQRERDAWKHADLVICASTFTKHSLIEAGCDGRRCQVVPYGVEIPTADETKPAPEAFRALFVGSGGQRKGLHHLLLAWQKASLTASSKLTLVCRVIDRGIERLISGAGNIELKRGATQQELDRLYAESSLFVMPSLVEGFGQAYLEALAQGCPVLGTANTCLPDLGGEKDGIFLISAARVEELVEKLEKLAGTLPGGKELRVAARNCAARFTWPSFRAGVRGALGNMLP